MSVTEARFTRFARTILKLVVVSSNAKVSMCYNSSRLPKDQSTFGGNFIVDINCSLCLFVSKAKSNLDLPTLSQQSPPTHDHVVL